MNSVCSGTFFFRFRLQVLLISLAAVSPVQALERIDIGHFSVGNLSGWKQKEFAGLTNYRLVSEKDKKVLESSSQKSASAFYLQRKIDLLKTPVLNWSWRKNSVLNPGDESTRSGDDYVARLYVIRDGGLFFWNTRAINYVWSYQHARGESWDNPYAGDKAKMVSVRDSNDPDQTWFSESRNVRQDFKALMGIDVDSIDGVAIMTDTDNSGLSAAAWYGDIYFTEQ